MEVVAIGLEAIVSSLLSPSLPVSVLGGGEVRPWTGTPIGPCHSPRAMSDDREVEAGIRSIRCEFETHMVSCLLLWLSTTSKEGPLMATEIGHFLLKIPNLTSASAQI